MNGLRDMSTDLELCMESLGFESFDAGLKDESTKIMSIPESSLGIIEADQRPMLDLMYLQPSSSGENSKISSVLGRDSFSLILDNPMDMSLGREASQFFSLEKLSKEDMTTDDLYGEIRFGGPSNCFREEPGLFSADFVAMDDQDVQKMFDRDEKELKGEQTLLERNTDLDLSGKITTGSGEAMSMSQFFRLRSDHIGDWGPEKTMLSEGKRHNLTSTSPACASTLEPHHAALTAVAPDQDSVPSSLPDMLLMLVRKLLSERPDLLGQLLATLKQSETSVAYPSSVQACVEHGNALRHRADVDSYDAPSQVGNYASAPSWEDFQTMEVLSALETTLGKPDMEAFLQRSFTDLEETGVFPPELLRYDIKPNPSVQHGSVQILAHSTKKASFFSISPRSIVFELTCAGTDCSQDVRFENHSARSVRCVLSSSPSLQSDLEDSPFHFPHELVVPAYTVENIQVVFRPFSPGSFSENITISYTSVDPGCGPAGTVSIPVSGTSEIPEIEVTPEHLLLDFSAVPTGCSKSMSLSLKNRSQCAVPVKLILVGVGSFNTSFRFSNRDTRRSHDTLISETHLDLVLDAAGCSSEPLTVDIIFQAPDAAEVPNRQSWPSGPVQCKGNLDILINNILRVPVKTFFLNAVVGIAHIHTPRSLDAVEITGYVNAHASLHLPVKNAGNIQFEVAFYFSEHSDLYTVSPQSAVIQPGEVVQLNVNFFSDAEGSFDTSLVVEIVMSGWKYSVPLSARVAAKTSLKPVKQVAKLGTDQSTMSWLGTAPGEKPVQSLVIRNNNAHAEEALTMMVHLGRCFEIVRCNGRPVSGKRATVSLGPKGVLSCDVAFRAACPGLEVDHIYIAADAGQKFKVPLQGVCGTSLVEVEGDKDPLLGVVVDATIDVTIPSYQAQLLLSNKGDYAAAVIVCILQESCEVLPGFVKIHPESFLLPKNATKVVRVQYTPSRSVSSPMMDCFVLNLLSADAWVIKNWRKQVLPSSKKTETNLDFEKLLAAFDDEIHCEAIEFPRQPSWKSIAAHIARRIPVKVKLPPLPGLDSIENRMNLLSLDHQVRPVSAPGLKSDQVATACSGLEVLPHRTRITLSLTGPGCSPQKLLLRNPGDLPARFEIVFPKNFLLLSLSEGTLLPRSELNLLVSARSACLTQGIDLPFDGIILIFSNLNCQKLCVPFTVVLNQVTREAAPRCPAANPVSASVSFSEEAVRFPDTTCAVKSCISWEFRCSLESFHSWIMSPCGPPETEKSKGNNVGKTEVFRLCPSVGSCLSGESVEIKVYFEPYCLGSFQQTWLLELFGTSSNRFVIVLSGKGVELTSLPKQAQGDSKPFRPPLPPGQICISGVVNLVDRELTFVACKLGTTQEKHFSVSNPGSTACKIIVSNPTAPFFIRHKKLLIHPRSYIRVPVTFQPDEPGVFLCSLTVRQEMSPKEEVLILRGNCSATKP